MGSICYKNEYIDTELIENTLTNAVFELYPDNLDVFNYVFNRILYSHFAVTPQKRRLLRDLYVAALSLQKEYIIPDEIRIGVSEIKSVFDVLIYDSPELMHVDYSFSAPDDGHYVNKIVFTYNADPIEAWNKLVSVFSYFKNIIGSISSKSAFGIELAIHDALCRRCDYEETGDHQNAYGVCIDGKAVCAGYSRAFSLGMLMNGIPCCSLSGLMTTDSGPGNHEWNLIKLDNEYYHVDVTNDDVTFRGVYNHYAFLNVTNREFYRSNALSRSISYFFNPDCTAEKYNYYKYHRIVFHSVASAVRFLYDSLSRWTSSGTDKCSVTMKFASEEDYRAFRDDMLRYITQWAQETRNTVPGTGVTCSDTTCVVTVVFS